MKKRERHGVTKEKKETGTGGVDKNTKVHEETCLPKRGLIDPLKGDGNNVCIEYYMIVRGLKEETKTIP